MTDWPIPGLLRRMIAGNHATMNASDPIAPSKRKLAAAHRPLRGRRALGAARHLRHRGAAHGRRGAAHAAPSGPRRGGGAGHLHAGVAGGAHVRSGAAARARTWLYAILRNCAISILRDESRFTSDPDTGEDAAPATESALARLPESSALRRCLERLDAKRRAVVVLAYVHGLSHGELAGTAQRAARHGEELGAPQPDLIAGVHGMTDAREHRHAGRPNTCSACSKARRRPKPSGGLPPTQASPARSNAGARASPSSTTPPSRSPPAKHCGAHRGDHRGRAAARRTVAMGRLWNDSAGAARRRRSARRSRRCCSRSDWASRSARRDCSR